MNPSNTQLLKPIRKKVSSKCEEQAPFFVCFVCVCVQNVQIVELLFSFALDDGLCLNRV